MPAAPFAFLDLSWGVTPQQRFLPREAADFELRAAVDFYGLNKLDSGAILSAYAGLEGSVFPSLYGATNPYDDFAECFATWVHRELLGRPYLLASTSTVCRRATLDGFWASPRSDAEADVHALRLLGGRSAPAVASENRVLMAA